MLTAGLTHLVKTGTSDDADTATWDQIQAIYRCWLYEEGQVIRRGFTAESAEGSIDLVGLNLRETGSGLVG